MMLDSQSSAIKESVIFDLKNFFLLQEDEDKYSYIENATNTDCNLKAHQFKLTYNTLQIKTNNKCKIIDLSKIRDVLNRLNEEEYIYNIRLNEVLLFTNQISRGVQEFHDGVKINEKDNISILLSFKPTAISLKEINRAFNLKLSIIIVFLIFSNMLVGYFWHKIIKEGRLRSKLQVRLDRINMFILENNSFIKESYIFSKSKKILGERENNDYFPLPIIESKQEKGSVVNFANFCSEIEKYFCCYNEYANCDNTKLIFDWDKPTSEEITIPFEKEILKQLIISVIFNLLNFSRKSNDLKKITIGCSDSIFIFITDGFKLNKDISITASQRIFFDSYNPFILSFSQIIGLLNRHGLEIIIDYDNHGSFIKIDLSKECYTIDNGDKGIVVNFRNFNKKFK